MKEKAEQLFNKYYYELESLGITNSEIEKMAKNSALFCVDEIILESDYIDDILDEAEGIRIARQYYWQEVKQEIKKL